MRVLAVGNMYPPHHFGGYELVWRSAVDHLRERGHTVRVLTSDLRTGSGEPEERDTHRQLIWHWRDGGYPRLGPRERLRRERHNGEVLERHLAQFDPDVVSWWSMGGMSLGLIERARRAGLPAVAFVHDDWLEYGRWVDPWLGVLGRRPSAGALAERLTGLPARVDFASAARYVFVSEATRRRALSLGLGLRRTEVAHSGIHPAFLDPAPESEWAGRLLYVGRLDGRKGIDVAIDALARLPGAVLTVVGGGDPGEDARLRARAARLGVEERVRWEGQRSRAALLEAYAACDAVLFPVRWEEPWGLVPLEAMARGRPVVASGRGGSGEYLRDGENCLLSPAGDAEALAACVRRLAAEPALRARLRAGGLETAPRHTEPIFNARVEAAVTAALPEAPRVSVVIPTYRRHEALARTLQALEHQTVRAGHFEVIVVDDAEDDDTAAVAAAIGGRPFSVRQLHRRARGVSAARNAGAAAARAPLLLFLGDDILAAPTLLAEHLAWHEGREVPVGVLGHVRWARELRTTSFMRWLEHGVQFDYPSIAGPEASWAHFYTANVSVPRALLEQVGGFDEERFPFLYEDLDAGRRLADVGMRLLYNRHAVGEHLHPTTIGQWRDRMAATASAERRWIGLRPEMPAYFHDLLADASAREPSRGLAGRLFVRWVPRWLPVLGPLVWSSADVHYRQQLAPRFLAAWKADEYGD